MRTSNLAFDLGHDEGLPTERVRIPLRPIAAYESRAEWREVLRDLGVAPETLARNDVPHRACTWVRGGIDVATGKVVLAHRDFSLGSTLAVAFDRVWVSSSTYGGPLGSGWHHAYDVALSCRANTAAVRMADGRVLWFTAPEADPSGGQGPAAFDSSEQWSLSRDAYGFRLRDADGCELRFVPHRAQHAHVLSSMRTLGDCGLLVPGSQPAGVLGSMESPPGREVPVVTSGFEHACVLGSLRPAHGIELRFAYDHRARLIRIARRGDCELELRYDRADRVISICAPALRRGAKRVIVAQYAYDARGNLARAVDAHGQSRCYAHEKHLITRWTDRAGCATRFEWDGPDFRARCVNMASDSGSVRALRYENRSTRVRDALGRELRFVHDGEVVSRIESHRGRVRKLVRGEGRRVERDVNALGRAVAREYDGSGRLTKLRALDGATWSFERDGGGRVVRAIDPLAGCWQLTYDSRGRVLSRADPLGRVTRYRYRGRWLVAVIKPGDRGERLTYDDAGHLESRSEPGDLATRYAYDAWGRVVSVQAERSAPRGFHYDALGRLVRVCDGESDVRELAYDVEGRLVRWKDPHRDVRFTYQGSGLLSSRTEAGMTVCFEYDREERLVAIVNEAGAMFQISRDASGAIVETTGFDGCKRRYTRDVLGRVSRVERAGEFSEFEYDTGNRPIEVHYSDGAFEGFGYQAGGALISAWNQDYTLTFERDACGQVGREIHGDHSVTSQFDATGRRTSVLSSFGPHQVYERDAAGRVARIVERSSGFEMRIERDANGGAIRRVWPANQCVCEPDEAGRPSTVRYEDSSRKALREFGYTWDGANRLTRTTDSASESVEYGYDARGNLTWRKTEHGIHQRRVFGPTGDVFLREDRRDREYGPAGQLLARSVRGGEVAYRYDDAGRLIERTEPSVEGACWRFAWSASGLLRSVRRPDGSEVTFGYDALGRRVWKKYRGQTTRFVWDGPHLLHEWVEGELLPLSAAEAASVTPDAHDPSELALQAMLAASERERGCRAVPITWLYDPDEGCPIAKLSSGEPCAVFVDLSGAPVQLRDPRGGEVWAADIAFTGGLRSVHGPRHACLLRGASMYEDLETRLYCECRPGVPARYYDPVAGVYLCQGALASAPALRPYRLSFDVGVEWSDLEVIPNLLESPRAGGELTSPRAERGWLRASDSPPLWAAAPPRPLSEIDAHALRPVEREFNPTKAGPQPRPRCAQ